MAKQSPTVLTGVLIDNQGRENVAWLDLNDNFGWHPPAPLSGNVAPLGGNVTLAGSVTPAPNLVVDTQATEYNQLGAWLVVRGDHFTPGAQVTIYIDGLSGRTLPFAPGAGAIADASGRVRIAFETRCWSGQIGPAIVRAVDRTTGLAATVSEGRAYTCSVH
jgi:hypothetical protein